MKTPFYELAERIAEDNYIGYYFADQNMDRDYYNFYYNIFAPTAKDVVRIKKELNKIVSDPNAYDILENKRRCLALLFADLLWQDEMKTKKK